MYNETKFLLIISLIKSYVGEGEGHGLSIWLRIGTGGGLL